MIPTEPALAAREPAVIIGIITTAVASIIAVLVAFGIDFTQGQQVAILGVIAGVGPLVVALVTRGRVAPMATVVALAVAGEVVAGPALDNVTDGTPVAVTPIADPGV